MRAHAGFPISAPCSCAQGDEDCECKRKPEGNLKVNRKKNELYVQRSSLGENTPGPGGTTQAAVPEAPSAAVAAPATPASAAASPAFIVEDGTTDLAAGQMKKSEFLQQLRDPISNAAQVALQGTMWSAAGSVAIGPWFQYYAGQSAPQLERTIQLSVPGSAGVTNASAYIPLVSSQVQSAVGEWARTGKVPAGVPAGLPGMDLPGSGLLGAVGSVASGLAQGAKNVVASIGTGLSSLAQGAGNIAKSIGGLLFKPKEGGARIADDPRAIQVQLGTGEALEGGLQGRMSSAFGHDFSGVRVHRDHRAAQFSSDLNARAFTIGRNVAFGAGEYQPGSPIGDALIAHELAHVVQQSGASAHAPLQKGESETGALEDDADLSAVRAVASLWTGAKSGLANISRNALPAIKSGLKLQRCSMAQAPSNLTTADAKAKWIDQAMKDNQTGASGEILKVFQSTESRREFLDVQKQLNMAAVIDFLDKWDAIQLGALGPITAGVDKLNQERADYIVDSTNDYGLERSMIFTLYIFNTMYTDDIKAVLQILASNKRMGQTILKMEPVKTLLTQRGLKLDDFKDRGEKASDFFRGLGTGISNLLGSSEVAKSGTSQRYYSEKFSLPAAYQDVLGKIETGQLEQAMSPGNMALGVFNEATLGIPVGLYGLVTSTVGGVVDLAQGNYEEAGNELTGATLLVLSYLGIKAAARVSPAAEAGAGKSVVGPEGPRQFVIQDFKGPVPKEVARLNAIVQLSSEGQATAATLLTRLGDQGVVEVAKYIQADSKAARFVYENGVDGADALQKAKGDPVAAAKLLPPKSAGLLPAYVESPKIPSPAVKAPADRHFYNKIKQTSVAKDVNTVILPSVDVAGDVEAINAGKAVAGKTADGVATYTVNGRTYGVEPNGTLYPISGEGLFPLDRGEYKVLSVYRKFLGDTPEANDVLNKMGATPEQRAAALKVWKAANTSGAPNE
jgi:hypothetical protein